MCSNDHSPFYQFYYVPSKQSTFNKRIVSEKNFKARSVIYPVGMTKDFECFIPILSSITALDSA